MTVDTEATKYIGLTIDWEYKNRKAHLHMPGYLEKAFTTFKHDAPEKNPELTTPAHDTPIRSKDTVRQGRR